MALAKKEIEVTYSHKVKTDQVFWMGLPDDSVGASTKVIPQRQHFLNGELRR